MRAGCYTGRCMTRNVEVLRWALFCVSITLAAPAFAAGTHVRSDGFYHGSLEGQVTGAPPTEVWSGGAQAPFTNNNPGEEEVASAAAHSGSNSWRFSSGYGSSGPGTPFSPPLKNGVAAGQPSSGVAGDVFEAVVWFKALNPEFNTQRIRVVAGNTNGTDRASNALDLVNVAGAGVTVRTFESVISNGWAATEIILASGVNDDWHELRMLGKFYDGCWNDTWTYSLDGTSLGTYTAYYEGARCNLGFTYETTSRLKFEPEFDNNATNIGFYFDDISYRVYRMAESNKTLASYSTSFEPQGPLGLLFMAR